VSLSSASDGFSTLISGPIKKRRGKGIFAVNNTRRPDRTRLALDAFESRWEKGFSALAEFRARMQHCRVPLDHSEGRFELGRWVALQRMAKDKMLSKYRERLNAIGFIWDLHEFAWEEGFGALTKFKGREGHCRVPRYHLEGEYKLGQWVSVQRLSRNDLSAERKERLNTIGFVWDGRKHYWENGFAALAEFKAREGHCRVPSMHIENDFKLGLWVTTKRRTKEKMPPKLRSQLNKIGFVWRAL
jgi:Helicase associated domain